MISYLGLPTATTLWSVCDNIYLCISAAQTVGHDFVNDSLIANPCYTPAELCNYIGKWI